MRTYKLLYVGVSKQFKFPECQVLQLFTYKNFFTAIAAIQKQNKMSVTQNLTAGYPDMYSIRMFNVGIGYYTLKLKHDKLENIWNSFPLVFEQKIFKLLIALYLIL